MSTGSPGVRRRAGTRSLGGHQTSINNETACRLTVTSARREIRLGQRSAATNAIVLLLLLLLLLHMLMRLARIAFLCAVSLTPQPLKHYHPCTSRRCACAVDG